jgi:hypothetical protein
MHSEDAMKNVAIVGRIKRSPLISSLAFTTVLAGLMVSAFATGIEKPSAARSEVGSCDAYGGLPAGMERPPE